jgi:hypothetical protein
MIFAVVEWSRDVDLASWQGPKSPREITAAASAASLAAKANEFHQAYLGIGYKYSMTLFFENPHQI